MVCQFNTGICPEICSSLTRQECTQQNIASLPFHLISSLYSVTMDEDETVTLLSSDHMEFHVPRAVAEKSETIKCSLAETSADSPVPLMNVRSDILEKIVEFCAFEVEAEAKDGEKGSKSADEVRVARVQSPGKLFQRRLRANCSGNQLCMFRCCLCVQSNARLALSDGL
jgi:hypothetical protein